MIWKRLPLAMLCAAALVACDAADSVSGPGEPRPLGGTFPPIEQPPIDKPPLEEPPVKEPPVEPPPVVEFLPGVPVLDPFAADDEGARELARGFGQFQVEFGTATRTFAFIARNHADGTTSGEYQIDNRSESGSRERGVVTCLSVEGNEAWIGGVITHSTIPGREGTARVFRVIDRGDGTPPDQASLLIVGDATVTCHTRPLIPVEDLESGRIEVRDAA
jgi:hypothetical protein